MSVSQNTQTGKTVFDLIADPKSQEAWERFVERYGPRIYGWCRRMGLQEADAQDSTQTVLAKLVKVLTSYDRKRGHFTPWLGTMTRNVCNDVFRGQQGHPRGSGDSRVERVLAVQATDVEALARELDAAFVQEMLESAMARVEAILDPKVWHPFSLVIIEGKTLKEAAAETQLSIPAVFRAKERVRKLVREEVARMGGDVSGTEDGE